jgi:hypothetical protein
MTVKRTWNNWKVNDFGNDGYAMFTYQVEGPKGRGTAEAHLMKERGRWIPYRGKFIDAANPGADIEFKKTYLEIIQR